MSWKNHLMARLITQRKLSTWAWPLMGQRRSETVILGDLLHQHEIQLFSIFLILYHITPRLKEQSLGSTFLSVFCFRLYCSDIKDFKWSLCKASNNLQKGTFGGYQTELEWGRFRQIREDGLNTVGSRGVKLIARKCCIVDGERLPGPRSYWTKAWKLRPFKVTNYELILCIS